MDGAEIALTAPVPAAYPRPPGRAANPYWVYLARFDGKESERTMRRCLDRVAVLISPPLAGAANPGELLPWRQIRYPVVVMIRARLQQQDPPWSPSHVNKHLCALRGVLKECWKLTLMDAEDWQRSSSVEQVAATRELAGRNIHSDEMRALLTACLADSSPIGIRDAAIIAVLQSTGIRRDEAASGLIERYDPGERALRVIGKGNKERTVYIHPSAVPYLDRWLAVAGSRRGPMFRAVDRWEHVSDRRLSARSVGMIVDRRRQQAGLQPASTHDFRRTFIGDFIDAGGDLVQAQQLAGHSSATTTARYDRRPGRERRAAVDRLSLPSPGDLAPQPSGGAS